MKQIPVDYLPKHQSKSSEDQIKQITYSFNNVESTIIGVVEEDDTLIHIYEYRGKYVGTEFFMSFAKNSSSYKLINVVDVKHS